MDLTPQSWIDFEFSADEGYQISSNIAPPLISKYLLLGFYLGADVHAKDLESNTALHIAYAYGSISCAMMLETRGADPESLNGCGRIPIEGKEGCIRYLSHSSRGFNRYKRVQKPRSSSFFNWNSPTAI